MAIQFLLDLLTGNMALVDVPGESGGTFKFVDGDYIKFTDGDFTDFVS